jgi:26S proteasome non-ATPase regulatory subunit 9
MSRQQQQQQKENAKQLMAKKELIEEEMASITKELTTSGAGLSGTLIDNQGFPRGDIDVHQTLILRNRLNCLITDHKVLMKELESRIYEVFAVDSPTKSTDSNGESNSLKDDMLKLVISDNDESASSSSSSRATTAVTSTADVQMQDRKPKEQPFLVVNSVAEGSPAAEAGLWPQDEILEFGEIQKQQLVSFGMKILADYVQKRVDQSISLRVLRQKRAEQVLTLKPHAWSGKGLLGCHLLPL